MNESKFLIYFLIALILICFGTIAAIPLIFWTPLESIHVFLGFLLALGGLTAIAFITGLISLLILCIKALRDK